MIGALTPSVKEYQDRLLFLGMLQWRSPDVQRQAVFALRCATSSGESVDDVLRLWCEAGKVHWSRRSLWTIAGSNNVSCIQAGHMTLRYINLLALYSIVSL